MSPILKPALLFTFMHLVVTFNSYCQKSDNKPVIVGQNPSPLTMMQGGTITITLSDLIVEDQDSVPVYPNGFALELNDGDNYKFKGSTVTPDAAFSGMLTVRVRVDDGKNKSDWFDLQISVTPKPNEPPVITGQSPLNVNEGQSITLKFSDLKVTDPDDSYPTGFTLTPLPGANYTVGGLTITPSPGFIGTLTVPVSVNDGEDESNQFDLKINVVEAPNVEPKITGQVPLSMEQGTTLTLNLTDLLVTDPDNNYPSDFTLKIYAGTNYTFNGLVISPAPNFSGELKVPVSVNDGKSESKKFDLKITVTKTSNVEPKITGQVPLSMLQGTVLTLALADLLVTDPDNNYPSDFTLKVYAGGNYTFNGLEITPAPQFSGDLKIPVSVNDGVSESKKFDLKITVTKTPNVAPQITGQVPLTMAQGATLTLKLADLLVTDPDNNYPSGFTLKVFAGINYSFNGLVITPVALFTGELTIPVSVNDGANESNRFDLKVTVTEKANVAPQITGQVQLTMNQGASLTLKLTDLLVTDPDNTYPTGFTMTVYAGNNYTFNGLVITPSAQFTGNLKVPVSVNDGKNESKQFELKVEVNKVKNGAPQITGQAALTMNQGTSLTLKFVDLLVTDTDSSYPTGFTMKVFGGSDYTFNGMVITPSPQFSGSLTVRVSVNDGQEESNRFDLKIDVIKPQNAAPQITGQVPLSTDENTPIEISLRDLVVTDPDNKYPQDFTLKISAGNNYSFAGNVVTPVVDFTGSMNVNVSVNDGTSNSPLFSLKITVVPSAQNVPPVISGQKNITITQNTSFLIQFSHLLVTDPDDQYPQGFTLKAFPGNNYTLNGLTVTPASNFVNGTLVVKVTVNDGKSNSLPFDLKIQVTPITARPQINGQVELTMKEDSTLQLHLTDLIVSDADNPGYPEGFTLNVLPGPKDVYTAHDHTITPALNLNGFIEVGVTVSDGTRASEEFKVSIFVSPVNDPPEILHIDSDAVAYEPGKSPVPIFENIELVDVDNDHLLLAQIGFMEQNYSPTNDELLCDCDSTTIKVIKNTDGSIFLVGFATLDQYRVALQSIQYNYRLTQNEQGIQNDILAGSRKVYVNVYDGTEESTTYEREIDMNMKISLDIPTAFTPNGDDSNDTWHLTIVNSDLIERANIRVYNKQGLLLYESSSVEKEWDGTFNGKILPVDTYYYTIDLNLSYTERRFRGVVTILR